MPVERSFKVFHYVTLLSIVWAATLQREFLRADETQSSIASDSEDTSPMESEWGYASRFSRACGIREVLYVLDSWPPASSVKGASSSFHIDSTLSTYAVNTSKDQSFGEGHISSFHLHALEKLFDKECNNKDQLLVILKVDKKLEFNQLYKFWLQTHHGMQDRGDTPAYTIWNCWRIDSICNESIHRSQAGGNLISSPLWPS